MFEYLNEKDKKKYKIIISSISVLLILTLVVIAGYAWFSMENNTSKYANIGVGKVRYVVDNADKMFYSSFELESDDDDGDDWTEEDGYNPATAITGITAGTEIVDGNEHSMMAGTKVKIKPILAPEGATDKVTYSSSDPTVVSVSIYGTVSAIGLAGESATITIVATDRTPGDDKRNDLTVRLKITITENTDEDNKYGYLPGNVDILRSGLSVNNLSTVDSKARVKINWQYSNYDESDSTETEGYSSYTIEKLYQDAGSSTGKIVVEPSVVAPLVLSINSAWSSVPTESNSVILKDINGLKWSVDSLFLTESDYESILTKLRANEDYQVTEKMIDSAYIFVCYTGGTTISDETDDYGAVLSKTNGVNKDSYIAVDKMITSEMYAGFSIKKVFSITVTIQARQAKFYDENNWFDVYCAKENYGETEHKVVTQ